MSTVVRHSDSLVCCLQEGELPFVGIWSGVRLLPQRKHAIFLKVAYNLTPQ